MNYEERQNSNSGPKPGIGLALVLRYLEVLFKWRYYIIILVLFVIILSIIILLNTPNRYTATVTILPSASENPLGNASKLLGLPTINPSATGDLSYLYEDILKSRKIILDVMQMKYFSEELGTDASLIEIFNIQGETFEEKMENGYLYFKNVVIKIGRDERKGITSINTTTTDPDLSAAIGEILVIKLNDFTRYNISARAKENRLFIEERIAETDTILQKSEEKLRNFRESNKRIENSPELQLKEGRLIREIRVQEEVYLTLKREYEIVKIEEQKDVPIIWILDEPTSPFYKSGPNRTRILIMVTMAMFVLACILSFGAEYIVQIMNDPGSRARLNTIWTLIANDFF